MASCIPLIESLSHHSWILCAVSDLLKVLPARGVGSMVARDTWHPLSGKFWHITKVLDKKGSKVSRGVLSESLDLLMSLNDARGIWRPMVISSTMDVNQARKRRLHQSGSGGGTLLGERVLLK